MAMTVTISLYEIGEVTLRASGAYAPDVMDDLTARAMRAATHAASLYVQIAQTHLTGETSAEPDEEAAA